MSLNGSGVYQVNSAGQPVVANTLITAAAFNAFTADIATALSTAIFKDGQQTVTANIPMAGFRFTGLGAGSAAGHSLRYEQLFTTSVVTLLGQLKFVKGSNVLSAATIDLSAVVGNLAHVTGTTQIDAVTTGSGVFVCVVFDGILQLTHHSTNNNLPTAANITTAVGDRAFYWGDGTTSYCFAYQRANGTPLALGSATVTNAILAYSAVNGQTGETAPATDDEFLIGDTSASALRKMTFANYLKIINALTEDTSPDTGNDFVVTYDASASGPKKVKIQNLSTSVTVGTPVATTSGTEVNINTSLPAGIKRLEVPLAGVSTDGTDGYLIQLGTGGSFVTSGYASSNATAGASTDSTAGFLIVRAPAAAKAYSGSLILTLENATNHTWSGICVMRAAGESACFGAGTITLSTAVDRVRITTTAGTNAFDAGEANVAYQS